MSKKKIADKEVRAEHYRRATKKAGRKYQKPGRPGQPTRRQECVFNQMITNARTKRGEIFA